MGEFKDKVNPASTCYNLSVKLAAAKKEEPNE
jgi:hypothetical protein